jgi:hypothetical protein
VKISVQNTADVIEDPFWQGVFYSAFGATLECYTRLTDKDGTAADYVRESAYDIALDFEGNTNFEKTVTIRGITVPDDNIMKEFFYCFVLNVKVITTESGVRELNEHVKTVAVQLEFLFDAKTPEFTAPVCTITDTLNALVGVDGWTFQYRNECLNNNIDFTFISGDMIRETPDAGIFISPQKFLNDFCKIYGYTYFFDANDKLNLIPIEKLFDRTDKQVHQLTNIKNMDISLKEDCLIAGLNVGEEAPNNSDYNSTRQSFCEVLNYSVDNNGVSDTIFDLVSEKIKTDYASILFMRYKFQNDKNQSDSDKSYKDVFTVVTDISGSAPYKPDTRAIVQPNLKGAFNYYVTPARRAIRFRPLLIAFANVQNNGEYKLTGQENIVNKTQSWVNWEQSPAYDFGDGVIEKKALLQLYGEQYEDVVFSQLAAKFTCLAEIVNIYLFDLVQFSCFGKTYTGIITEVSTTKILEEVEIEVLLLNY